MLSVRDAFGGSFMIKIILVFIVIFVSFMAAAVTYAKAFRVKNGVINILEQNQYNGQINKVQDKIDTYLGSVPYSERNDTTIGHCNNAGGKMTGNGACIVPKGGNNNKYYQVIVYISISLPFFHLNPIFPISGETKTITYN